MYGYRHCQILRPLQTDPSLLAGYTINVIRYLSSSGPTFVLSASHDLYTPPGAPAAFKPNVDRATAATLALPNGATASLTCDLSMPFIFGILPRMPQFRAIVQCEGGEIEIYNFLQPTFYHWIKVTTKDGTGRSKTRFEKSYTFPNAKMEGKGEPWWTTYRHQLEAFVDKLKGRTPQTWVNPEDSIANMECIEQIYAHVSFILLLVLWKLLTTYHQTGLGSRPKSDFVPPP